MFFVIDIFWKLKLLKHFVYKNHIHFSINEFRVDVDLSTKIFSLCKSAILHPINPIHTGQGRNQPLYERHVTNSGRNRVKLLLDAEAAEKIWKVI